MMEKLDMDFSRLSDDEVINTAFSPAQLNGMDRDDMANLIEELGRRYQNLLNIVIRLGD